jgi:hypothetical protein
MAKFKTGELSGSGETDVVVSHQSPLAELVKTKLKKYVRKLTIRRAKAIEGSAFHCLVHTIQVYG